MSPRCSQAVLLTRRWVADRMERVGAQLIVWAQRWQASEDDEVEEVEDLPHGTSMFHGGLEEGPVEAPEAGQGQGSPPTLRSPTQGSVAARIARVRGSW